MKRINIPILILTILMASCHENQSEDASYALADMEEVMNPVTRQSANESQLPIDKFEKQEVIKKKIIKDGRLGISVTDLEKAKKQIDTLIRSYGGYYANESFNNTDWETWYSLKIRIPFSGFETIIAEIENGGGEIQYKEIYARDVTDQFIDFETRLENKRNYLKRYNDLLKQAKTIKEVLEVEEKIRVLEEEIESTTGRLKYLSDLVDYSTLDLNIVKRQVFKYNPAKRDRFSERLKQSVSKGWFGFVDFMLFVTRLWPFWIIIFLMLYFWRKYKKTKRKKITAHNSEHKL
jgi:hypothetical protein